MRPLSLADMYPCGSHEELASLGLYIFLLSGIFTIFAEGNIMCDIYIYQSVYYHSFRLIFLYIIIERLKKIQIPIQAANSFRSLFVYIVMYFRY